MKITILWSDVAVR